jgi:hypothetical protein
MNSLSRIPGESYAEWMKRTRDERIDECTARLQSLEDAVIQLRKAVDHADWHHACLIAADIRPDSDRLSYNAGLLNRERG